MKETIAEKAARLVLQDRIKVIYADDRRAEMIIEGDTFLETGDEADLRTVKLYEDGKAICNCPSTIFMDGSSHCSHVIAARKLWRPKKEIEAVQKLKQMVYGSDEITFD